MQNKNYSNILKIHRQKIKRLTQKQSNLRRKKHNLRDNEIPSENIYIYKYKTSEKIWKKNTLKVSKIQSQDKNST